MFVDKYKETQTFFEKHWWKGLLVLLFAASIFMDQGEAINIFFNCLSFFISVFTGFVTFILWDGEIYHEMKYVNIHFFIYAMGAITVILFVAPILFWLDLL